MAGNKITSARILKMHVQQTVT